MGWLFGWDRRSHLIKHLTRPQESNGTRWEVIAHCAVGNTLWTVHEVTRADQPAERFIGCFLLQGHNGYQGWGYKDMEESMHPYRYTCPPKYLAMVPVACQAWRDKVLQYHARKYQKLTVGQRVSLVNCTLHEPVTIISLQPLRGRTDWGHVYKIPRRFLPEPNARGDSLTGMTVAPLERERG